MARIDIENHDFDSLADLKNLRGVRDFLRPGHFGDMDQPFDPAFQFNEGAVIHQTDDLALNARADRVFLRHFMPRIRGQLLHAE